MARWVLASRRQSSIEDCRRTARATERTFTSLFKPHSNTLGMAGGSPDSDYFAVTFDMPSSVARDKIALVPQLDSIFEAEVLHEPASTTRVIQVIGRNGPLSNVTVTPLYDGIRRRTTIQNAATDADGYARLLPRARQNPDGAIIASAPGYWSRWVSRFSTSEDISRFNLRPLPQGPIGWWHSLMGAYDAAQRNRRDALCERRVAVGVIDTGCGPHASLKHVDDHGSYVLGAYCPNGRDTTGHGTHVCGLIGARPSRHIPDGYVGVSPGVKLHSFRVGDADTGIANQIDIALALRDLVRASVNVVTIGLAAKRPSLVLLEAIEEAAAAGVLCVAAAGNSGDSVYYPAAFEHVVAVGAVGLQGWGPQDAVIRSYQPDLSDAGRLGRMDERQLFIPRFSPGAEDVTCVGPGVGIISCAPDRTKTAYVERSGTSMAAALVSGALATILARSERYQTLSPVLERTDYAHALLDVICHDLGASRHAQGRGIPMVSTPATLEARNRTLALFHQATNQTFDHSEADPNPTFPIWPRPLGSSSIAEFVPVALQHADDRAKSAKTAASMHISKSDMALRPSRGRKPLPGARHGRFSKKDEYEPPAASQKELKKAAAKASVKELLGCEPPWDIQRFRASFAEVSNAATRYDVWLFESAGGWRCPVCDTRAEKSSQSDWQVFNRRRDKIDVYVNVRIPVVDCPTHGRQLTDVPWTRDRSKWQRVSTTQAEENPRPSTAAADAPDTDSGSDTSSGENSTTSRLLDSWRRTGSSGSTLY